MKMLLPKHNQIHPPYLSYDFPSIHMIAHDHAPLKPTIAPFHPPPPPLPIPEEKNPQHQLLHLTIPAQQSSLVTLVSTSPHIRPLQKPTISRGPSSPSLAAPNPRSGKITARCSSCLRARATALLQTVASLTAMARGGK